MSQSHLQSNHRAGNPLALSLVAVLCGSIAMSLALTVTGEQNGGALTPDQINVMDGVTADRAQLQQRSNEVLQLAKSDLISLTIPEGHPDRTAVQVPFEGEMLTLDLYQHSNRADDFRVRIQIDDGSLVDIDPGPVNTYRGEVKEIPGSIAAATFTERGIEGMIDLPNGKRYIIEALAMRVPGATITDHVFYDADDAICEGGSCGVPQHWMAKQIVEQNAAQQGDGSVAGDDCQQVNLAIDADFLFFQQWFSSESSTLNRINAVLNNTNAIYEGQVGIRHVVTQIIIRTSNAANPYNCVTGGGSAENYLFQFRSVWNTNPESQIPRNVAHLFTNCNVDAGGIAFTGTVCQNVGGSHYSLATHQGTLLCQVHVTSHELGHNWNASHCDGSPGCSGTIMPAFYPPCSSTFASVSQNQITNYLNSGFGNCSIPCLTPISNNTCENRTAVSDGDTPFHNIGASTDGPDEPTLCTSFGSPTIQSDIWFEYTATCSGEVTFSLCGSQYNSKLGVYASSSCPSGPDTITACDNFSCPTSSAPEIILPASEGETFIIRVGSLTSGQGEGNLAITCEEVTEPDCPGDLNGDQTVNVSDLLLMLGEFGSCPGCDADLNGDDTVNVSDLLLLLGVFGACP